MELNVRIPVLLPKDEKAVESTDAFVFTYEYSWYKSLESVNIDQCIVEQNGIINPSQACNCFSANLIISRFTGRRA